MKVDAKEIGYNLLLGTGVIVLTPILATWVNTISFLGTDITDTIKVGTVLMAGLSAFGISWAIDKYLK